LPETFLAEDLPANETSLAGYEGLSLDQVEKRAIAFALERNKWKKMSTCRELGISKDTLRRKIEKYALVNPLEVA
jgi:transcriptional regulator with AAA-type ATPase domain